MPPLQLLIKPASGMCNLRCRYCFYYDVTQNREQENYGMMSGKTLENLVRKSLAYAEGTCGFAFQGGEPTLAGMDFYRDLIRLVEQYNTCLLYTSGKIFSIAGNRRSSYRSGGSEQSKNSFNGYQYCIAMEAGSINDPSFISRASERSRRTF